MIECVGAAAGIVGGPRPAPVPQGGGEFVIHTSRSARTGRSTTLQEGQTAYDVFLSWLRSNRRTGRDTRVRRTLANGAVSCHARQDREDAHGPRTFSPLQHDGALA